MEGSGIRYLQHHEINAEAWDRCISTSPNGRIYAYSYYLDAMAPNWGGLVMDDYAALMPLPWRKKYGISYIFQPALSAQLGVFGNGLTQMIFENFMKAIPSKFRYIDLPLNAGNFFPSKDFPLFQRTNYILDLNRGYDELYKNYRDNIRRNIKRCQNYGCHIANDVSIEEIISIVEQQDQGLKKIDLENFSRLFKNLDHKQQAKIIGVRSSKGELLAAAVFVFSHNRAYYILVANHPNGRTLGASHALIDAFVKEHAGQPLILDFEGSDIHNLAFFYSSFGAKEEPYPQLRLNRLPWWMKLFKK